MQNQLPTRRYRSPQTERARELRLNATPAEKLLWSVLRGKQVKGRKFRRQCPIGSYFADFACLSERLLVELDGVQHESPNIARYDRRRTVWLGRQHFRVLRFRNEEVLRDLPMVVDVIGHALEDQSAPSLWERNVETALEASPK